VCDISLEQCELWSETKRKARKEHQCSCCRRVIRPGEEYLVHFSVLQGDPNSAKCCAECVRDRLTFADAHGGTLCTPGYLPHMLRECISEEPETADQWGPMLERMRPPKPT
jgi:hypothetical protein